MPVSVSYETSQYCRVSDTVWRIRLRPDTDYFVRSESDVETQIRILSLQEFEQKTVIKMLNKNRESLKLDFSGMVFMFFVVGMCFVN